MDLQQQIKAEVEEIFPRMIRLRRDIHVYPELGYQEVRTSRLIASEPRKLGIRVKTRVAKTGVVGLLEGSGIGRTVVILGVANKRKGIVHDLHTPRFTIDEEAMKTSAGFFAHLTIEYLHSSR